MCFIVNNKTVLKYNESIQVFKMMLEDEKNSVYYSPFQHDEDSKGIKIGDYLTGNWDGKEVKNIPEQLGPEVVHAYNDKDYAMNAVMRNNNRVTKDKLTQKYETVLTVWEIEPKTPCLVNMTFHEICAPKMKLMKKIRY